MKIHQAPPERKDVPTEHLEQPAPVADGAADDDRQRDRRQGASLLGGRVRTGLLAVLAVLVAVLLLRPNPADKPTDFAALATGANAALAAQPGVTQSTGGYLPGTGIVLVSSVQGLDTSALTGTLAAAISALADPIAALPNGEALSWQVSSTAADGVRTQLVRVASTDVLDQTRWVLVPVTAGAAGAATGGSGLSAGATPGGTASTAGTASPSAAGQSAAAPTADAAPAATSPAPSGASAAAASAGVTTAGAATAGAATAGAGALTDDFATDSSNWIPLTGTWKVVNGAYQQTDNSGFDFISQFKTAPPAAYKVSVTMKGLADSMNAGLLIGQPSQGARKGATIVDLSSKDYLRWGSYDATSSTYKFIGGTSLGSAQDLTTAHTLSVTVAATGTTVEWDGAKVGSFPAVSKGYLGLVTSQSAVQFDDLTVTPA